MYTHEHMPAPSHDLHVQCFSCTETQRRDRDGRESERESERETERDGVREGGQERGRAREREGEREKQNESGICCP